MLFFFCFTSGPKELNKRNGYTASEERKQTNYIFGKKFPSRPRPPIIFKSSNLPHKNINIRT